MAAGTAASRVAGLLARRAASELAGCGRPCDLCLWRRFLDRDIGLAAPDGAVVPARLMWTRGGRRGGAVEPHRPSDDGRYSPRDRYKASNGWDEGWDDKADASFGRVAQCSPAALDCQVPSFGTTNAP